MNIFNIFSKCKYSSFSMIKPHLDFNILKTTDFQNNAKLRKIDVNFSSILSIWEEYKNLKSTKDKIETSRQKISEELIQLEKSSSETDKINALKLTAKILRDDLKNLKSVLTETEEILTQKFISLPNCLHPRTLENEKILHNSPIKPSTSDKSHIEIGKDLNILEFKSPKAYFLRNDAALLEFETTSYFVNQLLKNGFHLFSNPDFSRSIVIESLKGVNTQAPFLLNTKGSDSTYLNGGASLFPFISYMIRSISNLPVKYVSQGRQYGIPDDDTKGLYSTWQNNAVHLFIGSENSINEFDNVVEIIKNCYDKLNVPFKISYAAADKLSTAESLRVMFSVYSPFYKKYFLCGYISLYSEHISKILNVYYLNKTDYNFMNIISGTVFKFPPLLACILEQTRDCKIKNLEDM